MTSTNLNPAAEPGGELDRVTSNCIPDVTFDSDGSIKGSCERTGQTVRFTSAAVRAEVMGGYTPGGKINFTYDVTETTSTPGDPTQAGTWHITYTVKDGIFSSPTQASGVADFSFSCSSSGSRTWCGAHWDRPTEEFSGTIPWTLEAAP